MKSSLSPDVERLIAERLQTGHYDSADEIIREALDLLQQREGKTRPSPDNHASDFATAFEDISRDVPDSEWEKVPADLSTNLDRYL